MFNYQVGATPLQARTNMPFATFFIIFGILLGILVAIFFGLKILHEYHKSEKYINKIKDRITTPKDLSVFGKSHNLTNEEIRLMNTLCKYTQVKNINYSLKTNTDLLNLFRKAYNFFRENGHDEETISLFFKILYDLEQNLSQIKPLSSSNQIEVGTTISYLTENMEKLPFSVVKQSAEALYVEIPGFLYNSPDKPKPLDKLRFTFKTKNGLTYNFISRVIRYDTTHSDHIIMIISHSEKLSSNVQRHYKRDYCNMECFFSPIIINNKSNENGDIYSVSSKKYPGKLSNVSAGGCCIVTELPIKDHQYLCVDIPELEVDEKFIGIIKKTRRLTAKTFALHIQFTRISLNSRNSIFEFVYKFGKQATEESEIDKDVQELKEEENSDSDLHLDLSDVINNETNVESSESNSESY